MFYMLRGGRGGLLKIMRKSGPPVRKGNLQSSSSNSSSSSSSSTVRAKMNAKPKLGFLPHAAGTAQAQQQQQRQQQQHTSKSAVAAVQPVSQSPRTDVSLVLRKSLRREVGTRHVK